MKLTRRQFGLLALAAAVFPKKALEALANVGNQSPPIYEPVFGYIDSFRFIESKIVIQKRKPLPKQYHKATRPSGHVFSAVSGQHIKKIKPTYAVRTKFRPGFNGDR